MTRMLGFAVSLIVLATAVPAASANPYLNIPDPVEGILDGLELPASVKETREEICVHVGPAGCVITITCTPRDEETNGPIVKPSSQGIGIMVGEPQSQYGPYSGIAVIC